jgi:hypothetical protein
MHPATLALSQEFEASNIERFDWDKYGRVIEGVYDRLGLSAEDVSAVSAPFEGLLVLTKYGHVMGEERGLFSKRIEVGVPVSFGLGIQRVRNQKGPRGIQGMLIEGFEANGQPAFSYSWGCGGPVSVEDAAYERDRVFGLMQQLEEAASARTA